MYKRIAVAMALAVVSPSLTMAAGSHPMSGCGLGYVLFAHEGNDKVKQIFGATTNGTSGNQTFGISSGTSGCTQDGAVKFVKEAEVYAEVNLDSLRREMAAGQGEFVTTFASLLGASEANRPAVLQLMKQNYASIFTSSKTTSGDMLNALGQVLSGHQDLIG